MEQKPQKSRLFVVVSAVGVLTLAAILVVSVLLDHISFEPVPKTGFGVEGETNLVEYQHYAGPVLPLTLAEDNPAIRAKRSIELDFIYWSQPEMWPLGANLMITDSYTLTNTSNSPQSVDLLYPFMSTMEYAGKHGALLTMDGYQTDTRLLASPATDIRRWDTLSSALQDPGFVSQALSAWSDEPSSTAYVYHIRQADLTPEGQSAQPVIQIRVGLSPSRSRLLSWGLEGGVYQEDGTAVLEVSLPARDCFLILLGEDARSVTCSSPYAGLSAQADIERIETDAAQLLRLAAQENSKNSDGYADLLDPDLYCALMCQSLGKKLAAPPRAGDPVLSLSDNDYEDDQRVFWAQTHIDLQPNQSVELIFNQEKKPSRSPVTNPDADGISGYEVLSHLDGTLTFDSQYASIRNWGHVDIVSQNFGFRPQEGVTLVTLDPAQTYYFIFVRSKTA